MTGLCGVPSLVRVNSSVVARVRLLSLSLPAAAILLVIGQALTPAGLDHPITTLSTAIRELPIAAAHGERLYVANLLVIFGLGALGVSFAAIATLVLSAARCSRPRRRRSEDSLCSARRS